MSISLLIAAYIFQDKGSTADFLGKTPAQIVKMGRSKWFDYFTGKKGDTNADMMNAEISYAQALERVDNQEIARLDKGRQQWLLSLRKSARVYGITSYDLGMSISIQSNTWNLERSSLHAEVEELVEACLKGKPCPAKKLPSFDSEFKKLDRAIKAAPAQAKGFDNFGDYKQAPALKAKLKKEHTILLDISKKGTTADQRRIEQFMHMELGVARADNLP